MKIKNLYYGWVLVFLGASVLATNALAIFGFGVFLTPLTDEFGWERGAISGAFSVGMLIAGILSLISGRLSDRYGPRILVTVAGLSLGTGFLVMSQIGSLWQVYLVWGLFIGVGFSCSIIPITAMIVRWFTEKRGTAIALTTAGFGLGAVALPLFLQWLISAYGWQRSFLITGFIPFLITIPVAQFMKRGPQQIAPELSVEAEDIKGGQPGQGHEWGLTIIQAISTRPFWIFGLINFAFVYCVQAAIVHIVPHTIDIGISSITAASVLSVIAASSIAGQLAMGFLSDRMGGRQALGVSLILITLALVWLLFARQLWMLYLFAAIFGIAFGGIGTILPVVTVELFGERYLGTVFGAIMFFGTLGGAFGAPLAGIIFDVTESYSFAFIINAIIAALAIVLNLALLRYKSGDIRYH